MDTLGGDPGASLFSGGLASRIDAFDQILVKAAHRSPLLDAFLSRSSINGRGLLLALIALLLLLILPPLIETILRRAGHVKANFRGEQIPQSVGITIVIYAAVMLCASAYLVPAVRFSAVTWLIAIAGFGALGLLDDVRGNREASGLGGHFRAAFHERKITTGFIKAVGGLLIAFLIAFRLRPENPASALLAAAILALSANAVNLLDLRPGRAGAAFLLFAIPLVGVSFPVNNAAGIPLLLFVTIPALRIYARDSAAKIMLGDAGSNPLGAALALAFLEITPSIIPQIVIFVLLIALHLLAERASLTKIIEKNSILNRIDKLTGNRN